MLSQLAIGFALVTLTFLVHGVSLDLIIRVLRRIGAPAIAHWRFVSISLFVLAVFATHVVEIWIWAGFYFFIGEFQTFEPALYFSTSSFTTVGFGDVTLSEDWRLLSSMEAANGMILFGWSTAFIFEIGRRIYEQLRQSG
jgi:voltage-gated potassium channel